MYTPNLPAPITGEVAVEATGQTPEITYQLEPIQLLWGEYLHRHSTHAAAKKWMEEFKAELAKSTQKTGATILTYGNSQVATYRHDGNFNETLFQQEQPELAAEYTGYVTERKLDRARLAAEHPKVFAAYRARRLVLSTKASLLLA